MPRRRNDANVVPSTFEAIRDIASRLRQVGIPADEAAIEARIIVQHATGLSTEQLISRYSEPLDDGISQLLEPLVARRKAREPLAYIIGETEFYGRTFRTDRRALIPRPETELLVDLCLQFAQHHHLDNAKICDIGTGSGAIAVTLALELPNARITATDVSDDSLALAKINAKRYDVASDTLRFALDDIQQSRLNEQFNIVVSNPPYICSDALNTLQREVRDWEPRSALDGGADGMDILHPLLRRLPALLHSDTPSAAFIEMDPPVVEACLSTARDALPKAHIEVHNDFAGLERVLCIISI